MISILNRQETGADTEFISDVVVNIITPVGAPTTNPSEQTEPSVKERYITTSWYPALTSLYFINQMEAVSLNSSEALLVFVYPLQAAHTERDKIVESSENTYSFFFPPACIY